MTSHIEMIDKSQDPTLSISIEINALFFTDDNEAAREGMGPEVLNTFHNILLRAYPDLKLKDEMLKLTLEIPRSTLEPPAPAAEPPKALTSAAVFGG